MGPRSFVVGFVVGPRGSLLCFFVVVLRSTISLFTNRFKQLAKVQYQQKIGGECRSSWGVCYVLFGTPHVPNKT